MKPVISIKQFYISPDGTYAYHQGVYRQPTMRRGTNGLYYPVYRIGRNHTFFVARLVAEAYLPNPNGLTVAYHKDGNICNNHYTNLAWGTYADIYERVQAKHNGEHPAAMARKGHQFAYDRDNNRWIEVVKQPIINDRLALTQVKVAVESILKVEAGCLRELKLDALDILADNPVCLNSGAFGYGRVYGAYIYLKQVIIIISGFRCQTQVYVL